MRKLKTLVSLAVITASIFISSTVANASQWVKEDNNDWKYLNNNNTYAKGWVNDNGTWYYMDSNAIMQTGWLNDNGQWYYLNQDGSMARNTTINGYTLGSDGAWVSGGSNNSSGTSSGSTVASSTSGSTGKVNRKISSTEDGNLSGTTGNANNEDQSFMQNLQKNKK